MQKPVKWKFVDVCELHKLDALIDGAEMYSRITEEEDGDLHAKLIEMRAAHLLQNSLSQSVYLN